MRHATLAAIALIGMAAAAQAQTPAPAPAPANIAAPASNINAADTKSNIAPALPAPGIATDSDVPQFLRAARASIVAGRTGQAQEALEMAQTRSLDRDVAPAAAGLPSQNRVVRQIADALQALGNGERDQAVRLIDDALAL